MREHSVSRTIVLPDAAGMYEQSGPLITRSGQVGTGRTNRCKRAVSGNEQRDREGLVGTPCLCRSLAGREQDRPQLVSKPTTAGACSRGERMSTPSVAPTQIAGVTS